MVWDRERGRVIEEILVMRGMVAVDHLPMCNDHRTWSIKEQYGHVDNIRVRRTQMLCRLNFADLSEVPDSTNRVDIDEAWVKARDGHLKAVSVGYQVVKSVTLEAGERRSIGGRNFVAGDLPLRVATRWKPREGSLTVIQADDAATIRKLETSTMNEQLRNYLRSIGLAAGHTIGEAWDFFNALEGEQRTEAEGLVEQGETPILSGRTDGGSATAASGGQPTGTTVVDTPTSEGTSAPPPGVVSWLRSLIPGGSQQTAQQQTGQQQTGQQQTGQRTNQPETGQQIDGQGLAPARHAPAAEPEVSVEQRMRTETVRQNAIQDLFQTNNVNEPDLMARAINEGWTAEQTGNALLPFVRSQRTRPLMPDAGSRRNNEVWQGGQSVVRNQDIDSLACALMLRAGLPLDHPVFNSPHGQRIGSQVLRMSIDSPERQQALESANRMASMSLMDMCRMGLDLEGRRYSGDRETMIRSAISSMQVQAIFTTNVSARVLASYMDAPDTTPAWTTEEDVQNFQSNERVGMGKYGPLTPHGRGGSAEAMDIDANMEEYKIARYSGTTAIDEMDIIDDRLNGIRQVAPEDMGLAAAQLRPDLCYSELHANPNLKTTGGAVFQAAQGNDFVGAADALSRVSLQNAATAMMRQRIRRRVLNLRMQSVLAPTELKFDLMQILNSTEVRGAAAEQGTRNVIQSENLQPVIDDRLGAAGVVDPRDGTLRVGSGTNYFTMAQAGRAGARTMVVGFLSGTGRAPRINSWTKNEDCWLIGHAVKIDIGVKILDYRAMQRHAGQ